MATSEIFSDFTTRRHTTTPEKFGDKIGENRTDLYTEMMFMFVVKSKEFLYLNFIDTQCNFKTSMGGISDEKNKMKVI